ncbi:MAG: hypothetical protein O2888_02735, partial [Chloroflexi bacterium]|nr:hypothetical protein [Chloroflexota bacterium]
MQLEVCANCEEVIEHAAVYADGHSYCCAGCGAGSPCACIYTDNEPSENLRPAGAASVLRFPRSDDRLIVVQISGFADQRQVIRLAEAMEVSPALADVTLACLAEGDAWLTTHAASADAVARVMSMAHADGSLDIVVNQNLVEARLVVSDRNTAPAMDTAPADMGESRAAAQTEYPSAAYLDDVHPASTQVPSPDDESVLP